MYVNPFWMGVLVTLVVEMIAVIISAIVIMHGDDEDGEKK